MTQVRLAPKVYTMTRVLIPVALALVFLFFSSTYAFAQAEKQTQSVKTSTTSTNTATNSQSGQPPKKTSVNFEDQLIEGQTQKPELFYLLQQRNNNFKRLIKLRENFLPEMRKTSEDFSRRKGSAASAASQGMK